MNDLPRFDPPTELEMEMEQRFLDKKLIPKRPHRKAPQAEHDRWQVEMIDLLLG